MGDGGADERPVVGGRRAALLHALTDWKRSEKRKIN